MDLNDFDVGEVHHSIFGYVKDKDYGEIGRNMIYSLANSLPTSVSQWYIEPRKSFDCLFESFRVSTFRRVTGQVWFCMVVLTYRENSQYKRNLFSVGSINGQC